MDYRTYLRNYPDQEGRFGPYGGAYLSDELNPAFEKFQRLTRRSATHPSLSMNSGESAENFREDPHRSSL